MKAKKQVHATNVKEITATNEEEFKTKFIEEIYEKGDFRKVTKEEACLIQGFPQNFILPTSRARWMKLLGNSVSVPVIQVLCKAILETGVFSLNEELSYIEEEEMEFTYS